MPLHSPATMASRLQLLDLQQQLLEKEEEEEEGKRRRRRRRRLRC